ncbi:MAG: ABC transporter substrate-binding protein [Meiothermus sp.]
MGAYILRRIVQLIPTFVGATLLAFVIIQLSPGDFFTEKLLDPKVRPETVQRLREQFALDQPIYVQYLLWMKGLLQWPPQLGYSFAYQQDVFQIAMPRVLNSLVLVVASTVLLYIIAIPIGIFSAVRQYSLADRVVSFISYIFLSIPSFFFALIMIFLILQLNYFARDAFHLAGNAQILPVGGMSSSGSESWPWGRRFLDVLWHAIIPIIVVTARDIAGFTRFMRGQMLDVLGQDYIRTARAKGLSERVSIYKHALRNAVIPFVAGIGGILPALISGVGFVEVVMNWPGVTPFYLDALNSKDLYVLTGFLVIGLVLLMIGNLLSDLLLAWVDPRIRYY